MALRKLLEAKDAAVRSALSYSWKPCAPRSVLWLIRGKFAMRRRYPKTWEWRLALNHRLFDVDGVPTFHAYDASDHAACEPALGLTTSIAVPTRKSNRCPRCLAVVRKKR